MTEPKEFRPKARTPHRLRWSIPEPWQQMARATPTSSNEEATRFASSIRRKDPNCDRRRGGRAFGDIRPGKDEKLNGPKDLTIDQDGTVLIADTENHTIRRFNPKDGTISRVAGTGKKGSTGLAGSPKEAELSQPHGVTVTKDGAILISDSSNHRVLRIDRSK